MVIPFIYDTRTDAAEIRKVYGCDGRILECRERRRLRCPGQSEYKRCIYFSLFI